MLVKSADLPLEAIAAEAVTVYPTRLSLPEDGSNTCSVVLNVQPTADDVQVTVLEMPDNANAPPVFTSESTFEVDENETMAGTVIATDADVRDYVTGYALTGGDDQALFSVSRLGALTFDGNGAGEWSPSAEATPSNRRPTGESLFAPDDLVATAGGAVPAVCCYADVVPRVVSCKPFTRLHTPFMLRSGLYDLESGNIAGVFTELHGYQVDWLVQASIFVRVSLFF